MDPAVKLCPLGMELIKRLQCCSLQSLPQRFTGYGGRADEWRRDAAYGKGSVLGRGRGGGGSKGGTAQRLYSECTVLYIQGK